MHLSLKELQRALKGLVVLSAELGTYVQMLSVIRQIGVVQEYSPSRLIRSVYALFFCAVFFIWIKFKSVLDLK